MLALRAATAAGAASMNLAAIAAVKSGIDESWTIRWAWDSNGRLDLARLRRLESSSDDHRLWLETSLPARGLAYSDLRHGDAAAFRNHVASLIETREQRPWEALAVVKYDEWSGRHDLALEGLRSGAVHYLLSIAERSLGGGDSLSARRAAELSFEAMPASPDVQALLGHILVVYGTDQASTLKALEVLGSAVRYRPGDAAVERDYGHALTMAGRYDEALIHLSRAESERPEDPAVHMLLGHVFLKQGRRDRAVDEWRRAIRIDPKLSVPFDAADPIK
jgi:tetratricopeptide (TPR) repeat protein